MSYYDMSLCDIEAIHNLPSCSLGFLHGQFNSRRRSRLTSNRIIVQVAPSTYVCNLLTPLFKSYLPGTNAENVGDGPGRGVQVVFAE